MKKLIIFLLCVAILGGGGWFGYDKYKTEKENSIVVDVVPVNLMAQPASWFSYTQSEMDGTIVAANSQRVNVDTDKLVKEVFVEKGQMVKKGDPILEYDMTVVELELAQKENQVGLIEQKIKTAKREIENIRKYKPSEDAPKDPEIDFSDFPDFSDYPDFPEDIDFPDGPEMPQDGLTVIPVEVVKPAFVPATGNGGKNSPYIIFCTPDTVVSSAFMTKMQAERKYAELCVYDMNGEEPQFLYKWIIKPEEITEAFVPEWTCSNGVTIDEEGGVTIDSEAKLYGKLSFKGPTVSMAGGIDTDEPVIPDEPVPGEDSSASESSLPEESSFEDESAPDESTDESADENGSSGSDGESSSLSDESGSSSGSDSSDSSLPSDINSSVPDSSPDSLPDTSVPQQEEPQQQGVNFDFEEYYNSLTQNQFTPDPNSNDYIYTRKQIQNLIVKQENEVKSLELQLKQAKFDLETAKKRKRDGKVVAEIDGVVKKIGKASDGTVESDVIPGEDEYEEPTADDKAFAVIEGEGGIEAVFLISEMNLPKVPIGTKVYVSSWGSSASGVGEVTKIDQDPFSYNNYIWGENPTNSTFMVHAKMEDGSDFNINDGIMVSLEQNMGGEESGSSSVYMPIHYVRQEGGDYYIMKADADGKLKKQYIKVGQEYGGRLIEVKGGLSMDDKICFPYGKDVKEGVKTQDSTEVKMPEGMEYFY
ncbi:MAG: biotin/lipoyl-binding protein [Ruminococcus sp.]|nr:biotin/lipoyl-binding protein [Ruminococcus sp.]